MTIDTSKAQEILEHLKPVLGDCIIHGTSLIDVLQGNTDRTIFVLTPSEDGFISLSDTTTKSLENAGIEFEPPEFFRTAVFYANQISLKTKICGFNIILYKPSHITGNNLGDYLQHCTMLSLAEPFGLYRGFYSLKRDLECLNDWTIEQNVKKRIDFSIFHSFWFNKKQRQHVLRELKMFKNLGYTVNYTF